MAPDFNEFELHIEIPHDYHCEHQNCELSFIRAYYLAGHVHTAHGGPPPDESQRPTTPLFAEIKAATTNKGGEEDEEEISFR